MGRLNEYESWDDYELLRAVKYHSRDEYLARAYVDGRNSARDGRLRTDIPAEYACDSLAAVNWEVGHDDFNSEPKLG